MRDAQERCVWPHATTARQQPAPLFVVETREWLIEKYRLHIRPEQRSTEAHPLPLAAGNESAAFAERGLQSVRQLPEHVQQIRLIQNLRDGARRIFRRA